MLYMVGSHEMRSTAHHGRLLVYLAFPRRLSGHGLHHGAYFALAVAGSPPCAQVIGSDVSARRPSMRAAFLRPPTTQTVPATGSGSQLNLQGSWCSASDGACERL